MTRKFFLMYLFFVSASFGSAMESKALHQHVNIPLKGHFRETVRELLAQDHSLERREKLKILDLSERLDGGEMGSYDAFEKELVAAFPQFHKAQGTYLKEKHNQLKIEIIDSIKDHNPKYYRTLTKILKNAEKKREKEDLPISTSPHSHIDGKEDLINADLYQVKVLEYQEDNLEDLLKKLEEAREGLAREKTKNLSIEQKLKKYKKAGENLEKEASKTKEQLEKNEKTIKNLRGENARLKSQLLTQKEKQEKTDQEQEEDRQIFNTKKKEYEETIAYLNRKNHQLSQNNEILERQKRILEEHLESEKKSREGRAAELEKRDAELEKLTRAYKEVVKTLEDKEEKEKKEAQRSHKQVPKSQQKDQRVPTNHRTSSLQNPKNEDDEVWKKAIFKTVDNFAQQLEYMQKRIDDLSQTNQQQKYGPPQNQTYVYYYPYQPYPPMSYPIHVSPYSHNAIDPDDAGNVESYTTPIVVASDRDPKATKKPPEKTEDE